ncbi:histidine phosphatase family protein [Candidatus Roizmanbacteria bacterium]|nr:histidine phosphatase family protein [Candidatus Roizmanbacteria bacterium]
MKLYLVRYGGLKHNGTTYQKTQTLSREGSQQALLVAHQLRAYPLDCILTSDNGPAKEAAEIIGSVTQKRVEAFDSFREQRHPSIVWGRGRRDPLVRIIYRLIYDNMGRPDWHYSDEENFYDIRKRIAENIQYMLRRGDGHILIVGADEIVKYILCYALLRERLHPLDYLRFQEFMKLDPVGITVVEYDRYMNWHLMKLNG